MTREKFLHLMELVEEANRQWTTIQAEITFSNSCTVYVYDSRNGTEKSTCLYFTDDPYKADCIDGKPNPGDKSIVTYYDPTFERAERCLRQIIEDYKEKNNANA